MLRLDEAQKEALKSELLRLIIDIYGERSADEIPEAEIRRLSEALDTNNESRIRHLIEISHMIYANIRPLIVDDSLPETQERAMEMISEYFPVASPAESPSEEEPQTLEMPEAIIGKAYKYEIDLGGIIEGSAFDARCGGIDKAKGLEFNKNHQRIEGTPTAIGDFPLFFSFLVTGKSERTTLRLPLKVIPDIQQPIPRIDLGQAPIGEMFEAEIEFDKSFKTQFELEGNEETGLAFDSEAFVLSGIPEVEGEYTLCLNFLWEGIEEKQSGSMEITLSVYQNPTKTWEKKDPDPGDIYPKPLDGIKTVKIDRNLVLLAASKRGRAHEHNGVHREDDFHIRAHKISEWIVMAVADGTSKAPYSRKGAELACKVAEQVASKRLEEKVVSSKSILENAKAGKPGAVDQLQELLTFSLTTAVYNAYLYIKRFASSENKSLDEFGTTLRLTLCKPMGDDGYFVASLAVGDGVTTVYTQQGNKAEFLQPESVQVTQSDENLMTTPEISEHTTLLNERIVYRFVDDLSAVMTMTNGVSQNLFAQEDIEGGPTRWQAFFQRLKSEVFEKGGDLEEKGAFLLKWLEGYAEEEVDDRTLAVLWNG